MVSSGTLDTLVETRLLRAEPNTMGGISYEVSHDSLIKPILESREKRKLKEKEAELEKEILEHRKNQRVQRRALIIISAAFVVSVGFAGWAVVAQLNAVKAKKNVVLAKHVVDQKNKELVHAKLALEEKNQENKKMLSVYVEAEINREKQVLRKTEHEITIYTTFKRRDLLPGSIRERDSLLKRIDTLINKINSIK